MIYLMGQEVYKGPSINDISFEVEGGGYQKRGFEPIFMAKTGATGGRRGSRNCEIEERSFMDVP